MIHILARTPQHLRIGLLQRVDMELRGGYSDESDDEIHDDQIHNDEMHKDESNENESNESNSCSYVLLSLLLLHRTRFPPTCRNQGQHQGQVITQNQL